MIAVVVGTRPEIIKIAPVIRELINLKVEFEIVHSNQHYSAEMDTVFFKQLNLPPAHCNLHVGSGTHAQQTAKILLSIEKYFLTSKPNIVIVHGDTNTTLGAALAASKLCIPVAHVEAGLRSRDMSMPEEVNRIITDKISSYLYAPTQQARKNLLDDGIADKSITVTGNTVVDAVTQHIKLVKKKVKLNHIHNNILPSEYIFVTAHRPSNVDSKASLTKLTNLLSELSSKYNKVIVWPLHPRTKNNLSKFSVSLPEKTIALGPTDYFQTLTLIQNSFIVATDSGGIQEEAYILKKPAITLRDNTERPETLTANFLVGLSSSKAKQAVEKILKGEVAWNEALGSGNAGHLIVENLINFLES